MSTINTSICKTLKKTFSVIPFVIFTILSSSAFAIGVEFNGQVQTTKTATSNAGGNTGNQNVHVSLAECNAADHCEDVKALLLNSDAALTHSNTRIVVSDLPAEVVASELTALNLNVVKTTTEGQSTLGFFDIDKNDSDLNKSEVSSTTVNPRHEKIQAVIFTTLQTGVGTLSLLFLSKAQIEPTIAMTIVGGMTNLYYNWDVERWDYFQRWGRNKIAKGLGYIGIESWQKKNWFNTAGKFATGTIGRIAFIGLFTGISLWGNFTSDFLTIKTLERIGIATLLGTMTSQPYDNVFGDWMEKGHRIFSLPTIHLMARMRSLISAGISPLVYAGSEMGYAGALGLFAGGVVLMVYDRFNNLEQKIDLNFKTTQSKSKTFWQKLSTKMKCTVMLQNKVEE